MEFGGKGTGGGGDRMGFCWGEGELGRKTRNPANDTAFSRGVVGIGMGWVHGRRLRRVRAGAMEIEGGFGARRGRWARTTKNKPTTPRFHAASLAMRWYESVDEA
jgi:hypothetical protein